MTDEGDRFVSRPASVTRAHPLGGALEEAPLSPAGRGTRSFGRLYGSQPLRYLVVGGWNTLFGYLSFAALYYLFSFHVHYMLIMVVSTVINITNAYVLYKLIVFRTRGNYLREYLRFYAVYAVPIASGFLLFPFAIEVVRMNAYLAQAVIMGLTVVSSYLGHKHISFRPAGAGSLPD